MSIVADVSDKCTPAECYVLDRSDMGTLLAYLHTPENKKCGQIRYFVVSLSTHILNSSLTITGTGLLFN